MDSRRKEAYRGKAQAEEKDTSVSHLSSGCGQGREHEAFKRRPVSE